MGIRYWRRTGLTAICWSSEGSYDSVGWRGEVEKLSLPRVLYVYNPLGSYVSKWLLTILAKIKHTPYLSKLNTFMLCCGTNLDAGGTPLQTTPGGDGVPCRISETTSLPPRRSSPETSFRPTWEHFMETSEAWTR